MKTALIITVVITAAYLAGVAAALAAIIHES